MAISICKVIIGHIIALAPATCITKRCTDWFLKKKTLKYILCDSFAFVGVNDERCEYFMRFQRAIFSLLVFILPAHFTFSRNFFPWSAVKNIYTNARLPFNVCTICMALWFAFLSLSTKRNSQFKIQIEMNLIDIWFLLFFACLCLRSWFTPFSRCAGFIAHEL